jgi:fructose-1,6-bisphosphatase/inositol monophosphatase family enzyme/GNAT superfamily N-acetyltransferase
MTLPSVIAPTTRPAEPGDLATIVSLVERMGGHDDVRGAPDLGWVFGEVLQSSDVRSVVALLGSEVVGYVEIHARPAMLRGRREAWVAVLAVDDQHRSHGIGSALVAAADRAAARLGCDLMVLETSTWREDAHRFYEREGFSDLSSPARRLCREVQGPVHVGLVTRFLDAAARGASAAAGAVAGLADDVEVGQGADGAPTGRADLAAEEAVVAALSPLGLAVVSEESGNLVRSWSPDEPWISLDPLDGSRNHRRGHPPWATAIGLVVGGESIAGFVLDHTSGRRWWASSGSGAWVDGRPARPVEGGLVAVPSVGRLEAGRFRLPLGYQRVRMTGSTAIDLCRVADGTLGAFLDVDRGVVHPHDLAGPLAILTEAGAAVARLDRAPLTIEPDPADTIRLAAAATLPALDALLSGE